MKWLKYLLLVSFGCQAPETQTHNEPVAQDAVNKESDAKIPYDTLSALDDNKDFQDRRARQFDCLNDPDKYQFDVGYKKVKHGVYLRTSDSTFHFLTCYHDGKTYFIPWDTSVDVETLEDLGEFWVDRNAVFYEFQNSDGLKIYRLDTADRATFKIFENSIYARDKNHVYVSRHGLVEQADVKTFKPIYSDKGISVDGKDENHTFFWNKAFDDTDEPTPK